MKWETWDSDVEKLDNVSGECVNGTTMDFHMKTGSIVTCTLSNVVLNKSLTFSGTAAGGLMKFEGDIRLEPVEDSTKVDYTFGLSGVVGSVFQLFKSKYVIGGTETGLENIVRMSEEAQKSG